MIRICTILTIFNKQFCEEQYKNLVLIQIILFNMKVFICRIIKNHTYNTYLRLFFQTHHTLHDDYRHLLFYYIKA